ncbi:TcpQ domain-containing protein [Propionivibrio sp.]|uniref:TcpQ domain-containing protein n=1 Tax=Propionivibrio sp. TaxID=2212460 RepID=UPI00262A6EA6|nr:TcpQ domain-containing protein [Propionivibrio sp.]
MKDRSCSLASLFLASAAFALGASLLPSTAEAGFQWVAPVAQPAPSAVQVPPDVLAPSLPPATPVADAAPQTLSPPFTTTQEAASAEVAGGSADEKPLRGFANNVPLEVALRQVLPPDYAFALADGVDGGHLVSWQGGGLWRQTLQDMLRTANLGAVEQGKNFTIVRAAPAESAAVMPSSELSGDKASVGAPIPLAAPVVDNQPLSLVAPAAEGGASAKQDAMDVAAPPGGVAMMSTPASSPDSSVAPAEVWTANRGESLRTVLEEWSKRANVQVTWQAEYDYPLQASVNLSGSYQDVVRRLLMGFQDAQPQPVAALHESADAGQSVLVVRVRGNNYSD